MPNSQGQLKRNNLDLAYTVDQTDGLRAPVCRGSITKVKKLRAAWYQKCFSDNEVPAPQTFLYPAIV